MSQFLDGSHNIADFFSTLSYKFNFMRNNPTYFDLDGLLVFCGPQGAGKTLSAVQYCKKVLEQYPKCIFCSNVAISGLNPETRVVPYTGLSSLSDLQNGQEGVLYLIDEIHLEWNSLESKSISIEEMTEFAQQRKQRKHIVGTSQVFMRLAKPLREQIKRVVVCENWAGILQHNFEIDGTTAVEENGKLVADIKHHYYWFHRKELYDCYDTYAKMQRYKEVWGNRRSAPVSLPYDLPGLGGGVGGGKGVAR